MRSDAEGEDELSFHSHLHTHDSTVNSPSSPIAKLMVAAVLVVAAALTAVGMVTLWPDYSEVADIGQSVDYAVSGAEMERGTIEEVFDRCDTQNAGSQCLSAEVRIESSGELVSVPLQGEFARSGLRAGDEVELLGYPEGAQSPTGGDGEIEITRAYSMSGIVRHLPLLVLVLAFVAVVVAVGRLRGALALLALGVSAGVVLGFVLPALLTGAPAILVALVGSSAILFATLYFVHGPTLRTTAALIGTLAGVGIMALLSTVVVHVARLSGLSSESTTMLSGVATNIDFRGLLVCAIIIAGLGILNDVTITQTSAVWELRAAAPGMSSREVYRRAMRIGRDHIASTVYTVFFAYVGAALSVLIMLYLYDRPLLSLLTEEELAVEVVSTLCGSIGLVLAVPITTRVATLLLPPSKSELRSQTR